MSESRRDPAADRPLVAEEVAYVAAARATAFTLYDGVRVRHRSCGVAIAATFGLPTPAYQALRRGGITGAGTCGALRAGEQVLGEVLGDPDPGGAVTPELRAAITWYQDLAPTRIGRDPGPGLIAADLIAADLVCNHLVRPLGDFAGPRRHQFCTNLAAELAALTAEAMCRFGTRRPPITPLPPEES